MQGTDVPSDLADLFRQYRIAAGLTQEALAERAGVGLRSIQGIERGERLPRRETLQRMIGVLALSAEQSRRLEAMVKRRERPRIVTSSHQNGRERLSTEGRLAGRSHLPVPLTSFIGRERELSEVHNLLRAHRLVTLTGPPGVGKTRLAVEVATRQAENFGGSVRLVSLAAVGEPDLVLPTLAQAMLVEGYEGQPLVDRLIEILGDRQILIVLDNFEQVVSAAPLVVQLLEGCPQVRVLATSRTRLRVRGEREFAISPLTVPDLVPDDADSGGPTSIKSDAVRLFVDRARDVGVDLVLDSANLRAIAEICQRLDCLPLAIELAAARCKIFSPPALLARLSDRSGLLTVGPRDLPPRQQTLRNAIAWSHDLLDPDEGALLRRLAVFTDGFTLDAAKEVCGANLDRLTSLVDKSLLQTEAQQRPGDDGEPRFRMLETIREFAEHKLVASDEEEIARAKHAAYFLVVAESGWADCGFWTIQSLDRFDQENGNLRAMLQFLIDHGDVERASRLSSLWMFWVVRGYVDEARSWLGELLARTRDDDRSSARANLLFWNARIAFKQCDNALAGRRLEESLAIFRELGNRRSVADALGFLGLIASWQGEYDKSQLLFEESLAIWQELDDQIEILVTLNDWLALTYFRQGDAARGRALLEQAVATWRARGDSASEGMVLHNLGCVMHGMEDYPAAQTCFEQSLAIAREAGFRVGIGETLAGLGDLALDRGEMDDARRQLAEALPIQRDLSNRREIARILECFAGLAALQSHPERAVRLWASAAKLREIIAEPVPPDQKIRLDRRVGHLPSVLGEEAFGRLWAAGQAMPLADAIAEALMI